MKPEHYNLDHYAALAKKKNYRSRASFKLLEMNTMLKLFRKDMKILDLGAAPGSWSQVAHELCGENSIIFGIDILPVKPYKNIIFLQKDINHLQYDELLIIARENNLLNTRVANNKSSQNNTKITETDNNTMNEAKQNPHVSTANNIIQDSSDVAHVTHSSDTTTIHANQNMVPATNAKNTSIPHDRLYFDLVLCDICPNKSGNAFVDSHNMHTVNINTVHISKQALSKQGVLIMKCFQDGYTPELKALLEKTFHTVKVVKPSASRSISSEMYYYAKQLR